MHSDHAGFTGAIIHLVLLVLLTKRTLDQILQLIQTEVAPLSSVKLGPFIPDKDLASCRT